jgi:hypothetical protein
VIVAVIVISRTWHVATEMMTEALMQYRHPALRLPAMDAGVRG